MKRLRTIIVFAVVFATGGVLGFLISRYSVAADDFYRATALGYVISEMRTDVPLALLDLHEMELNRQDTWLNPFRLNWNTERININLRRYIAHSHLQQHELAEDDLVRAARLQKHGAAPNAQDLDFQRELAGKDSMGQNLPRVSKSRDQMVDVFSERLGSRHSLIYPPA